MSDPSSRDEPKETKAKEKPAVKMCFLCNQKVQEGQGNTEHVIPKCLYPGKLPADVLTLPAHTRCNSFTARDEEVFRNHISVGIPPENPGHALWNTTWRAIHRPQAAGMQRDFYENMLSTLQRGEDGVLRKSPVAARIKHERADWVLAKIVRGLFTIQTEEILPPPKVRWRFGPAENGREQVNLPNKFSVHNVLHVSWGRAANEPLATMWLLGFHETAWFWVTTMPTTQYLRNRFGKAKPMIWPGPK